MQWTSVAGFFPGDMGILPLVALGLLRRDASDELANRFRRRLVLPAAVIGLGSTLALLDVGLTSWATKTLISDVIVSFTFLGLFSFVRRRNLPHQLFNTAVTAAGLFVSVIVLSQRGYRPAATFAQTNMTAHFIAAAFVFTLTRESTRRRLVALPIMGAAVALTSSFGALLSIGVVIAWYGYGTMRNRLHRTPAIGVMMLWATLVGGAGFLASSTITHQLATAEADQGLSQQRLDKSGEGRKDIWLDGLHALGDDPLGIGPGGFKPLKIHVKVVNGELDASEIHHDLIGYVVERGYIGLIGLGMLLWVFWSVGRKRGTVRGLLLMNLVAGLFRETLHFRHLWIYMAIAVATELVADGSVRSRVAGRSTRLFAEGGAAPRRVRAAVSRSTSRAGRLRADAQAARSNGGRSAPARSSGPRQSTRARSVDRTSSVPDAPAASTRRVTRR